MKQDIATIADIKTMVDTFYNRVNENEMLSVVFNDFAQVHWDAHLPRMYEFWNNVLFASGSYSGNPFQKHIPLPIDERHFDQWLSLFEENINAQFEGEIAEKAKLRARSIGHIFQTKLKYIHGSKN